MTTVTDRPHLLRRLVEDDLRTDPHPYLAWIRENHPVNLEPDGFYLLARHVDCMHAFNDEEFRRPERNELLEKFPLATLYKTPRLLTGMVTMHNPPEHTRLRRLFTQDFNPRRINGLRESTTRVCERVLDCVAEQVRGGGVADLTTVSRSIPNQVVATLVGIPDSERDWLYALMPTVVGALRPDPTHEQLVAADAAGDEVSEFLATLVELRRREPKDDLLSAWAQLHDDDDRLLSREQLESMMWGMVVGAVVTTRATFSACQLATLRHPELASWVLGSNAELESYIDEVSRHDSVSFVTGSPYFARRDIELSGVLVPEGAEVRTMITSANRDRAVFPDPDRFDPARDNTQSLTFGRGLHHCLGVHLAKMQLMTYLPILLRRFPNLVLADEPRWGYPIPVRALEYLPVTLG